MAWFTVTKPRRHRIDAFTPAARPAVGGDPRPRANALPPGRVPRAGGRAHTHRSLMVLSLTFDHRVVDGEPAAALLDAVVGALSGCSCSAGESGRPSSRAFRSVAGLTGRTERSSMIGIAAWRAFGRAKLRDLRRARTRSPRTMIFAVAMTKRLAGQRKRRHRVVTLRAPAQRSHQLQDQERQARRKREERECRGGAPAAPSTTLGGTAGLQKLRRTADDGRRDTWRSVCRWRIAARH